MVEKDSFSRQNENFERRERERRQEFSTSVKPTMMMMMINMEYIPVFDPFSSSTPKRTTIYSTKDITIKIII